MWAHPDEIEALLRALETLRMEMMEEERRRQTDLHRLPPQRRPSGQNLLHYLALRKHDLRPLQRRLSALGLSSLGRTEAHVIANMDAVISALHRISGRSYSPPEEECVALDQRQGRALLELHTENLLGPALPERFARIMVTMPSDAATDYALVHDLLAQGMNCMRINCAHDQTQTWLGMIENLRRAQNELGKTCLVHMDLGGPKLRTGPLRALGRGAHWHPRRTALGQLSNPAHLRLVPTGSEVPEDADEVFLAVSPEFLGVLSAGDQIDVEDARGSRRHITVTGRESASVTAEAHQSGYVVEGALLEVKDKALETRLTGLPEILEPLVLQVNDELILTADQMPGQPAERDAQGPHVRPARIACTLPSIFPMLKAGERIWFDDGKIGGVIESADEREVRVRIVHARAKGERLRSDKGINLPDSRLALCALTEKDLEDLKFAAEHADMVGLSFVGCPEDVILTQKMLTDLGAHDVGLVLKIETLRAFEELPELLLTALRGVKAGVMIARGDLAVEVGYERLAEVQEEVLWLCEAAHVPVIWATQVLESMAKKGLPSRAEITDAAMSERAECVMLNKGPHIRQAIAALDSILRRMQDHQAKKSSLMRPLNLALRKSQPVSAGAPGMDAPAGR